MALTPDSEQSRAEELAARREREQEVLLREVDEAVRQDQLGNVVKRYGWPIAGAVTLALAAFGGWLYWSDHREKQIEERSEKLSLRSTSRSRPLQQASGDLTASVRGRQLGDGDLRQAGPCRDALRDNRQDEAVRLYEASQRWRRTPALPRPCLVRAIAIQFDNSIRKRWSTASSRSPRRVTRGSAVPASSSPWPT